ncbi:hypothetical protein FE257_009571 [Aspergillus nanangensis]|uniref:Glutathione transferase n=1 Tax=Aspergillus nanangensis TaxID=2582783 RepID=A0AAD4CJQ9_ASPNN|nr:hypothetical protein FE257_009571 [Aspergillus nanangensis]
MDPPDLLTAQIPRALQPDSLSSVAEDASTLAAEQEHHHHHHHRHQQQEQPPLAQLRDLSTQNPHAIDHADSQSLPPLHSAVEQFNRIPYALPQHELHADRPQRSEAFNGFLSYEESMQQLHGHKHSDTSSIFSSKSDGYLRDLPSILDPPDLDLWREKLFNVDEMIVLSEEQFRTYFPHIDNIYSHRSTQHYKRKPLVSHYWDCRLKGRPPGTPKSDDPNKKKRKRTARQRDLCDVKIKITEYFPGYSAMMGPDVIANGTESSVVLSSESLPVTNALYPTPAADGAGLGTTTTTVVHRENQPFGVLTPNPPLPEGHPGANGQRFFTIQRVNGNGANGKDDGVSGGHRHTLDESDRVKKNSVQRYLLKEAREEKRKSTSSTRTMSVQSQPTQKTYHTKATGLAAETAESHSQENELKLYGSCFCPFVQRVWIALEAKGIRYQYIEIDPYKKPPSLLEVNPRGLVPALRHGDWGSYESSVLMEYVCHSAFSPPTFAPTFLTGFVQLEDLNIGPTLLPVGDAKMRAHCRLWSDYINRHIVPNFYRVLQEQNEKKQISNAEELRDAFNTLITAADARGPFFLGPDLSFVDVQVAPWILRLSRALKPYRGWPDPEPGSRWAAWVHAIEANEHVKATTSTDELYLDSYERYAQNRPNTSQVANAINSGRGLP